MDLFFRAMAEESSPCQEDIVRCPFLRNINEPTNFSFSSSMAFPLPVSHCSWLLASVKHLLRLTLYLIMLLFPHISSLQYNHKRKISFTSQLILGPILVCSYLILIFNYEVSLVVLS